jgi:hypothetical protein
VSDQPEPLVEWPEASLQDTAGQDPLGFTKRRTSACHSGWPDRTRRAQTMPSLMPGADLDLVRPHLAPDLGASRLDVPDVLDLVDHLAVCQQLSVVLAAVDTRDEAVDASPDANGIVFDLAPR